MNTLKFLLHLSFLLSIVTLTTVSCASEQPPIVDVDSMSIDNKDNMSTRSTNKELYHKTYNYKTLATFTAGQTSLSLETLAQLQSKQVNFVVIYEAKAPWADAFNNGRNLNKTGNDILNGLIESYELTIIKQFEIDSQSEGFVLEPNKILDNPVETAREISLVDNILLVQVKEVPSDETRVETAANN